MKLLLILVLKTLVICSKSEDTFDVTDFGADVKGVDKSSAAVQKAIDAAVANGGGTVYFPTGQYLCGPIHLKSDVTLHLADDAVIKFSTDFDDYLPMVTMRWEGTEVTNFSPLIYAYKQNNITIRGKGVLDGQGSSWWQYREQLLDSYTKSGKRDSKYQKEFLRLNNLTQIGAETEDMTRINLAFLRPPFFQPFDSKNILIQDVTFKNSPFWNLNPVYCEGVTIKEVRIEAPVPSPNTDGIDPDSCKDVYISKVWIDVGDDCIAIKSGRDLQGRRIGRPTENVIIRDSHMFRGHSGVAIGSEQSGGVRNVTVSNCVFNGTDRGVSLKSTRGRGGIAQNINFKNISMIGIKKEAILMSMTYALKDVTDLKPEPFSDKTPVFKDIKFEKISGDSMNSISLSGLPESLIQNVKFSSFDIISDSKHGLVSNYTQNLQIIDYVQRLNKTVF